MSDAVDIAAKELIAVATPREGFAYISHFIYSLFVNVLVSAKLHLHFLQWQLHRNNLIVPKKPPSLLF